MKSYNVKREPQWLRKRQTVLFSKRHKMFSSGQHVEDASNLLDDSALNSVDAEEKDQTVFCNVSEATATTDLL